MAANPEALDEGLLASCYSWMRKAAEDKMDGGCCCTDRQRSSLQGHATPPPPAHPHPHYRPTHPPICTSTHPPTYPPTHTSPRCAGHVTSPSLPLPPCPSLPTGMVALLQKVLQLYACHQLGQPQGSGGGGSSSDALLDELLAADEGLWTRLIRANADTIRCEEGGCRRGGRGRGAEGVWRWVRAAARTRGCSRAQQPGSTTAQHPRGCTAILLLLSTAAAVSPRPVPQRGGVHGGATAAHGGRGAGPALGIVRAARAGKRGWARVCCCRLPVLLLQLRRRRRRRRRRRQRRSSGVLDSHTAARPCALNARRRACALTLKDCRPGQADSKTSGTVLATSPPTHPPPAGRVLEGTRGAGPRRLR